MKPDTPRDAMIIWDYMRMHLKPAGADCLLVLGSRDDRVAAYAARLSHEYTYTYIAITGGVAHSQDLLATKWGPWTEAEHFAEIFRSHGGVGAPILEQEATNTGQNAMLTHELLRSRNIDARSLMIVTKPYMERRALATFEAQWPNRHAAFMVTSQAGSLEQYCNKEQPFDAVVNIMVGDMQRIIEYPKRGLQSVQAVPEEVLIAYENLVHSGYTKHLINA